MDKETRIARQVAREANLQTSLQLLTTCKSGETVNNGYNLWVHSSIYTENGGRWNKLGTTSKEVRSFLEQDLRTWIQDLRENKGDDNKRYYDVMMLDAYFLGDEAMNPIPHEELGTTPEEMNKFKRDFNIKF